jgi:phospholipase C
MRKRCVEYLVCLAAIGAWASCGAGQTSPFSPPVSRQLTVPYQGRSPLNTPSTQLRMTGVSSLATTPIQHVVIIFQENRTPDYLFQGVPRADISRFAIDRNDQKVPLLPVSLAAGYDLGHSRHDFARDYDRGTLDGFDHGLSRAHRLFAFGYAPRSEVKPYVDMATQYVFADRMFQSNQGPSLPAHLYIVTGTAAASENYVVTDNPYDRDTRHGTVGGCDAPKDTLMKTVDLHEGSPGPPVFPCFDHKALSDFLDAKRVSWRYYEYKRGPGVWQAFDAIKHVRYGRDYANVVSPSQRILRDIKKHRLADVSWVTPGPAWSDHAGKYDTTKGPAWVAAIVNAIGESSYWNSTAIFITWDDWGGWYDHVKPPIFNYGELGFRVPLVIVSPYARRGYVSKVQHEFGSILAFTEETYGIPKGSLEATDVRADDLMDAFDFHQQPRKFIDIPAPPFDPGPNTDVPDAD